MHDLIPYNDSDLTDEEILARSLASPAFFGLIVDRYQDAFVRKADHILHNREEALDVVQDAFTKIYLNAGKFKPVDGATFRSWAYKILVNTALTSYMKTKKERGRTLSLDPEYDDIIADVRELSEAENRTIRDYITSVFVRMPQEFARVLELHFLEGHSHTEIAHREGITIAAVKTRVYRAKQLFKKINDYIV